MTATEPMKAKTTAEQRAIMRMSDEPHVQCLLDDLESAEARIRVLEREIKRLRSFVSGMRRPNDHKPA